MTSRYCVGMAIACFGVGAVQDMVWRLSIERCIHTMIIAALWMLGAIWVRLKEGK